MAGGILNGFVSRITTHRQLDPATLLVACGRDFDGPDSIGSSPVPLGSSKELMEQITMLSRIREEQTELMEDLKKALAFYKLNETSQKPVWCPCNEVDSR